MIIIWRAEFDGDRDELDAIDRKLKDLGKEHGFSADGPYLPQDASLLYILHGTVEQMNASGREFLPWIEEQDIDLTPLRYEIGVTPAEFWGS